LDVAARAGYETPEAFARAFKRVLSVTPTEFRRAPTWEIWRAAYAPIRAIRKHLMNGKTSLTSVNIVQFPATRVAVLEHRGSHDLLHESIQKFISYRRRNHLSPQRSATFNLVYDDPHTTPPEAFRLDLCCAVTSSVEPNPEGVVERTIPGGKCASLRCRGGDEALEACLQYLYATWLPSSGEEPRDVPLVLQRIAFFPDVSENDAITDILLPLA
jgi:AraC family transcriptional regulator